MKRIIYRALQYGITTLLTLGVIIATGLLSFSGALLIYYSIPVGIAAFLLSGGFEGEVFRKNILKGLGSLKLLTHKGIKALIIKQLDHEIRKLIKLDKKIIQLEHALSKNPNDSAKQLLYKQLEEKRAEYLNNPDFFKVDLIKDYYDHQRKIIKLTLIGNDAAELRRARKTARTMQSFFVNLVLGNEKSAPSAVTLFRLDDVTAAKLDQFVQQLKAKLPTFDIRLKLLRLGFAISVAAGIGSTLATASQIAAISLKFAFLAILTTSSALVWPLAIVAGIGYVFMIYNTFRKIIFSDTFNRLWRRRGWFARQTAADGAWLESKPRYYLRSSSAVILIIIAVGLAIAATVFTAGTWWYAVQGGARLLPYVMQLSVLTSALFTPMIGLSQLIFNIENSLQTVKQILQEFTVANFKKIISAPGHWWRDLKQDANWPLKLNPFRFLFNLLRKVCMCFMFTGHVVATGAMTDRFAKLQPIIPAILSGFSEWFQDFNYFTEDDDIPHCLLKLLLSPLLLPALLWDYVASKIISAMPANKITATVNVPVLKKPANDMKLADEKWLRFELTLRLKKLFTKEIARLESKHADAKKKIIEDFQEHLLNVITDKKQPLERASFIAYMDPTTGERASNNQLLNELDIHRGTAFFDRKTKSAHCADAAIAILADILPKSITARQL